MIKNTHTIFYYLVILDFIGLMGFWLEVLLNNGSPAPISNFSPDDSSPIFASQKPLHFGSVLRTRLTQNMGFVRLQLTEGTQMSSFLITFASTLYSFPPLNRRTRAIAKTSKSSSAA